MGIAEEVARVLRKYERLKQEKEPWLSHYQLIGQYIRHRKQNFTTEHGQGAFLTAEIFDTTASEANERFASALIGNIWPSGAKTIKINPADSVPNSKAVKEYFEKVTKKLTGFMDEPRAGLSISLQEYAEDLGAFGTCGQAVFENKDIRHPLSYKTWDVKRMVIDEDKDGFVNTIGAEYEVDVETAVDEYGRDKLPKKYRDAYDNGQYNEKVRFLIFVEPRRNYDNTKQGNKNMAFATYHIELTTKTVLKESGFTELPVFVSRMSKATGEKYGRSPGIDGLPDILTVNAMAESILRATEKNLDPPLAVADDSVLGNEVIDTSAGGLNVFSMSGRTPTDKPIFPLFTVGEMKSSMEFRTSLQEAIWKRYKLDMLLDLNNQTRMTLGEAQIRNRIRSEGISSMFVRQEVELLEPMIIRSFNICFKLGLLGIVAGDPREKELRAAGVDVFTIPQEVIQAGQSGQDIYEIQYISPAKRIMQAEELQGIMTTMDFVTTHAQVVPDLVLSLKDDEIVKRVSELTGAPMEIINDLETIKALRQARQQAVAAQAKQEAASKMAASSQNMAQAMATMQGSQSNAMGGATGG